VPGTLRTAATAEANKAKPQLPQGLVHLLNRGALVGCCSCTTTHTATWHTTWHAASSCCPLVHACDDGAAHTLQLLLLVLKLLNCRATAAATAAAYASHHQRRMMSDSCAMYHNHIKQVDAELAQPCALLQLLRPWPCQDSASNT
jgi:hypothetical protein